MKGRIAFLTVLLLLLASTAVFAADRSDFVGTWKQDIANSPTRTSLKSYVNKVEINGNTLKVTTTTGGDRGERTYDKSYAIGKEEKSQDRDGDEFTTTVHFEGNSLVILTTEKERSQTLTTKETWTLSPDGKKLTKVRKLSGGSRGDTEQTYIFDKSAS